MRSRPTWRSATRSPGGAGLRGRAWNAGADEPVAVLDLVRRLITASGRDLEPDVRGDGVQPGEIDRQWLDSMALRTQLGLAPALGLDEGLAQTYAWYAETLGD